MSRVTRLTMSFLAALASPVLAAGERLPASGDPGAIYAECAALAERAPETGFEEATAWEGRGGGPPARHCAALALTRLGQFEEAAIRLQAIAEGPAAGGAGERAALYGQAGSAWLAADQPEAARAVLDAALTHAPDHPDYLVERARAHAALEDWRAALDDLNRAIVRDPGGYEAFSFRAAARRASGDLQGALADADHAVALAPGDAGARLERGRARARLGDVAGARADYLGALKITEAGPVADAARAALEALDLGG